MSGARSGIRFAITSQKGLSPVLDITVNESGTVIVKPRVARYVRPDNEVNFSDGNIVEAHCSIHPTRTSDTGNLIHFTQRHLPGAPFEARQFTQAIKVTNKFAPIFLARMANPVFNDRTEQPLPKYSRLVPLGPIRTDLYSLFYFVLAGPRDKPFVRSDFAIDTNVKQFTVGDISIVLLWSFLCHGSHNTGEIAFFQTTKHIDGLAKDDVEWMKMLQQGLTEFEAVLLWWDYRKLLVDHYRTMLRREIIPHALNISFMPWLRFFEIGVVTDQNIRYLQLFGRNMSKPPTELLLEPECYRELGRGSLIDSAALPSWRERLGRWLFDQLGRYNP